MDSDCFSRALPNWSLFMYDGDGGVTLRGDLLSPVFPMALMMGQAVMVVMGSVTVGWFAVICVVRTNTVDRLEWRINGGRLL